MNKKQCLSAVLAAITFIIAGCTAQKKNAAAVPASKSNVVFIIEKVSGYWQTQNPAHGRAFQANAAYHTGNIEAYFITGREEDR